MKPFRLSVISHKYKYKQIFVSNSEDLSYQMLNLKGNDSRAKFMVSLRLVVMVF